MSKATFMFAAYQTQKTFEFWENDWYLSLIEEKALFFALEYIVQSLQQEFSFVPRSIISLT